jgi:hypothetical protein
MSAASDVPLLVGTALHESCVALDRAAGTLYGRYMHQALRGISHSILFVCIGNICRSPAGENVMRRMLRDAALDQAVRCDSAGITDYHTGAPPDARMRAAGLQV